MRDCCKRFINSLESPCSTICFIWARPSISPSSAITIASRFSLQMSIQIAGCPDATRVISLKPPAARRKTATCSSDLSLASPINAAAVKCGRWLTIATSWSCRCGSSTTISEPSSVTTPATCSKLLSEIPTEGVNTQTALSNNLASAPANPMSSLPAIGCPPINRGSLICPTRWAFTPPTSVTKPVVSVNARTTCSAIEDTGVATNVMSESLSTPIS